MIFIAIVFFILMFIGLVCWFEIKHPGLIPFSGNDGYGYERIIVIYPAQMMSEAPKTRVYTK